jgi:hypothetical protein
MRGLVAEFVGLYRGCRVARWAIRAATTLLLVVVIACIRNPALIGMALIGVACGAAPGLIACLVLRAA